MGTYQLHKRERDWPLEELTRQLHVARAHSISGAAQFRSQFVTDNVKGIHDYLRHFYSTPALVPAMPWLSDTPPAMPQGFTAENTHEATVLRWQRAEGVQYNIYGSNTYPVDTTDPANLIVTYSTDTIYTEHNPSLALRRHYAITAIDRYGNESAPLALNHAPELDIPILNQGNKLMLPSSDNAQEVLICNAIGEIVSKVKYHPEVSLELLPEGFYLVYALDKDGGKTLVGTILK